MLENLAKKVTVKGAIKVAAYTLMGVTAVLSARETDENVQKVCKKAASKFIEKTEKGSH